VKYNPRKRGALCDKCPRKEQTPVPPEGPLLARWCWLGQDPGKNEVKKGRPFIGATGKRLARIWMMTFMRLELPEVPRKKVWITNAALCMPVTKGEGEAKKAIECCRPRLYEELNNLHPDAWILAMGKGAFAALTRRTKGVAKYLGFHKKLEIQ
jgi:uracil-DNA glycosylase family 4